MVEVQNNRQFRKWTKEEDERLVRQIKAFPQNLSKCFMIVSEEIGRTEGACAGRWYTKLSKEPHNLCFFTASPQHVSRNRKNGEGVANNRSVWRRLVTVLRSLHLA